MRQEMREQKAKAQVKKQTNCEILPTPCRTTHTLIWINHHTPPPPPPLRHLPIIHKNKTMDTEFQVQMRQSNKCGSLRNEDIFN